MFVIQSGFGSVRSVALSPNRIAAESGDLSDDEHLDLPQEVEDRLATGDSTWEAKAWSIPPEEPSHYVKGSWGSAGLVIDPRDNLPMFFDPTHGVRWATGQVACVPRDSDETSFFFSGWHGPFAISPDGKRMICGIRGPRGAPGQHGPGRLIAYTRRAGSTKWTRSVDCSVAGESFASLAFLPNGKQFILVELGRTRRRIGKRLSLVSTMTLKLFDPKTLAELSSTEFSQGWVSLAATRDWVAISHVDSVQLRNLQDLSAEPTVLKLPHKPVPALAADPHGRFLLTASGNSVSVWDPKTWTVSKTFAWKAGPITCLAVAPDGLTAAAGTATGKVVVWDME